MIKNITYNDTEIFYHVYGAGKPLVLLHGFGETSSVWKYQIESLKSIYKLIVPDLPGSGKSGELNIEITDISLSDFSDCVYSILQNENIKECIMLGHSMGGYIVLAFAEKYAGLLKAFGLVHSTAFADSDEKKKARSQGIKMIETYGSYSFLKTTLPALFSEKFKKEHPEEISELIEEGKQFTKRSLQQYYHAMMVRPDRTDVLRNSVVPNLFVIGTEDVAAPLNDVLKQAHLPEMSYIHILENTGHMGIWEAANELNEYLEEFVNESE
jgi:pimeloyl-ACP methyl ester carboxylesterase